MFKQQRTSYTLVKNGPDVNPRDVELPDTSAVEVVILWGDSVLHVAHVVPPKGFVIGESACKEAACDFFVPEEVLGTTRFALVAEKSPVPMVRIPAGACGTVELPGQGAMSIEHAARSALLENSMAAHELSLPLGGRAQFTLGDFTFQLAAVAAGKPCQKGLVTGFDSEVFSFFGMSLAAIGSFMAAAAFLVPTQNGIEDDGINSEQVYLIRQYMSAIAEKEAAAVQEEQSANVDADSHEGGTGTRAKNEEGSMGKQTEKNRNGRFGIAGPSNNQDVHMARDQALNEARKFGMIGVLNSGIMGDPNAPTAPWGQSEALGNDAISAQGNMWGDEIKDAFGSGGLGLSGVGEGGGGRGEGVGMGAIGTIGHGAGTGTGQGFGRGGDALGHGGHKTRVPRMTIAGNTIVSGRLPPEVIQRIVRQNYGRFRMCYEQGLSRNPNLQGRVQVRFVIGRDGSVTNAQRGDSDLPDSGVVSCVVGAYYGLSFPQPEGGIVTVAYPIMFQPG